MAIIAVGVCLGFLPHNAHPARIFMGDAGALFLGLLLAASTILVGGRTADQFSGQTFFFFAPLVIPFVILGVPMLDIALAVVRRAARRTSIAMPDKEHLHHRLMRLGHGQRRAVFILWAWTAVLAGFVLAPTYTNEGNALVPFGIAALALVLYAIFHPTAREARRAALGKPASTGWSWRGRRTPTWTSTPTSSSSSKPRTPSRRRSGGGAGAPPGPGGTGASPGRSYVLASLSRASDQARRSRSSVELLVGLRVLQVGQRLVELPLGFAGVDVALGHGAVDEDRHLVVADLEEAAADGEAGDLAARQADAEDAAAEGGDEGRVPGQDPELADDQLRPSMRRRRASRSPPTRSHAGAVTNWASPS